MDKVYSRRDGFNHEGDKRHRQGDTPGNHEGFSPREPSTDGKISGVGLSYIRSPFYLFFTIFSDRINEIEIKSFNELIIFN